MLVVVLRDTVVRVWFALALVDYLPVQTYEPYSNQLIAPVCIHELFDVKLLNIYVQYVQ